MTETSHLMYLDAKNLYGWEMSQKLSVLPVNGFNPNKAGLFEGSFSWGWGQLTPRRRSYLISI